MLQVVLIDPKTKKTLHSESPYNGYRRIENETTTLVVSDAYRIHGTFQTATIAGAATTTLTSPEGNGSLIITDVVIGSKKVAGSTLTLQFNDQSNQAVIISPDTVNQPVNFSWAPQGRIQGWRGADVEVVTTGANTDATVTIGYMKVESGLPFKEWDSYR